MEGNFSFPHQELTSWNALQLVLQLLQNNEMNDFVRSQLNQQLSFINTGGLFTISIELDLFKSFYYNQSLASWMITNANATHNLWRRALFQTFEEEFKLWSEDQICLHIVFDSLPVEPKENLSSNSSYDKYMLFNGIITSIADPFIEMFFFSIHF